MIITTANNSHQQPTHPGTYRRPWPILHSSKACVVARRNWWLWNWQRHCRTLIATRRSRTCLPNLNPKIVTLKLRLQIYKCYRLVSQSQKRWSGRVYTAMILIVLITITTKIKTIIVITIHQHLCCHHCIINLSSNDHWSLTVDHVHIFTSWLIGVCIASVQWVCSPPKHNRSNVAFQLLMLLWINHKKKRLRETNHITNYVPLPA